MKEEHEIESDDAVLAVHALGKSISPSMNTREREAIARVIHALQYADRIKINKWEPEN